MARLARFKVIARLDMASTPISGTVTIDRDAGLFSVRPKGRRQEYTLPLADVADMVVHRLIQAEVGLKLATKVKRK